MALKTNPDARYQTAREFKEALQVTTGTVPQPIRKPAAELGAGECPECHIPNESSRKFCSECAAPLRVSCLKCEAEIPVWDKVCGECGGKQSELAAAKLEEFASRRAEAEDCRRSYLFEEAIRIGRTLAEVDDERIAEHVPWAAEFVTSTEADWKRARESAEQHFEEAQTHRAAFDYQSAIHTLHSVPDAMRTSGMSDYLNRLESDQAESEELIATISDRVKRRDLKGLLEQVERAVALRGDRADLDKLAGQLREREEKRQRDKTTRLFDSGDAKGALAMLRSVPSEKLSSDDKKFLRRLEEIVSAEVELRALLKESKAGGVLAPKEVVALWKATNDYLQLNPHHEQIAGLQQQLKSRIRRTPELWNWYRTRLTLDVAKRFLATPESMPPLSWYESMSDEAAEALANHSGNRLSVAGLTRLSVEAAQLGHGECPKCHTRNESSRNFCSECEAPLRVRCLNCETEIPVWDNYCDECGGNQSELAASKLEAAKALAKRTNTLVLSGLTSLSVEAAEALAKHTGDLNYDDAKLPSDVVSILKDGGTRLTLDSDVVSILKDGGARLTLDVAQRFLADPRSTYLFDYETIELDAAEALAKHADSLYLDCLKSLSVEVAEALAKHTDSLHLNGLTSLSVEVAEALAKHTDSLWLNGLTSLSMEVAEALAKHKDSLIVNGLTSLSVEAAETLAKHQSYISYDAAKLPPDVVSILKRDATKLTRNVYTAQDVDVVLTGFGNNKIAVMKVVRAATGLGLKAAKEVVENAPTVVKECISKEDAEKLKEDIEGVGGSVEIKAPTLDTAQDVDVVLTGFGDNKIAVMKVVRAATGLGLKEAKEVVENAPTVVKECISSFSAEQLKEDIEGVGGSVEIKAVGSKNRTDLEAP
jgi:large subunit ribosomal protein L7/L12